MYNRIHVWSNSPSWFRFDYGDVEMTWMVKCNNCNKIQEAGINELGDAYNPFDDKTGSQWYSRLKDGKTIHACSRECITEGLVWPA